VASHEPAFFGSRFCIKDKRYSTKAGGSLYRIINNLANGVQADLSIGNRDYQSYFTVLSVVPIFTTSRSCFRERAKLNSNYLRTNSGGISGCIERGGGNIGEDFTQY